MEWKHDVGPARSGDAAAKERLGEYLTPFVHAAALANAPHHVVDPLVPRILEEALGSLASVTDDASAGLHAMAIARRVAREAAGGSVDETAGDTAALTEARQIIARLRVLPEATRERVLLRFVEGVPGPEIAEVTRTPESDLRADLERGAADTARLFGQSARFIGDGYLWELAGTPPPFLARLEMQLPVLRYDPAAATASVATPVSSSTFLELAPVGKRTTVANAPALGVDSAPRTAIERPPVSAVPRTDVERAPVSASTPGAVERTRGAVDLPAEAVANPFEQPVRTIPASDLPAAARGVVPTTTTAPPRSSAKLPQQPAVAPSPSPSKSFSSSPSQPPSKPKPPVPDAPPDVPRHAIFDNDDSTQAQLPAGLRAREVATAPEGDAAVGAAPTEFGTPVIDAGETRVGRLPIGLATDGETRVQPIPVAPPPPARATGNALLAGSTPFIIAAVLVFPALLAGWLGIFRAERTVKSSWSLVEVVVAAEDLNEGAIITQDRIAFRSVPDTSVDTQERGGFAGVSVVKAADVGYIIGQHLAMPVQAGDPLFYESHFVERRSASERLSTKVQKRSRAIAIGTSSTAAVGRFLQPNDRVDVVVKFVIPERGADGEDHGKPAAATIAQNVPVIATGTIVSTTPQSALTDAEKEYSNISVLLLPEEVEMLTLASSLGTVTLTLRNEEDNEIRDLQKKGSDKISYTSIETLIDGKRHEELQRQRFETIKIIRGAAPEKTR